MCYKLFSNGKYINDGDGGDFLTEAIKSSFMFILATFSTTSIEQS